MREVPDWQQYFMEIAKVVSTRSKDPKTQVGAVLVDSLNRIIGTGYNGLQSGSYEYASLWNSDQKHDYVVHAEMNAILNAVKEVRGSTLYVTLKPCPECAKLVGAAGIKEVFYLTSRKYANEPNYLAFCPMTKMIY